MCFGSPGRICAGGKADAGGDFHHIRADAGPGVMESIHLAGMRLAT